MAIGAEGTGLIADHYAKRLACRPLCLAKDRALDDRHGAIKGDWQIDEEMVLTPMLRVAHSMRWLSRDLFVEQDSIDGLR